MTGILTHTPRDGMGGHSVSVYAPRTPQNPGRLIVSTQSTQYFASSWSVNRHNDTLQTARSPDKTDQKVNIGNCTPTPQGNHPTPSTREEHGTTGRYPNTSIEQVKIDHSSEGHPTNQEERKH